MIKYGVSVRLEEEIPEAEVVEIELDERIYEGVSIPETETEVVLAVPKYDAKGRPFNLAVSCDPVLRTVELAHKIRAKGILMPRVYEKPADKRTLESEFHEKLIKIAREGEDLSIYVMNTGKNFGHFFPWDVKWFYIYRNKMGFHNLEFALDVENAERSAKELQRAKNGERVEGIHRDDLIFPFPLSLYDWLELDPPYIRTADVGKINGIKDAVVIKKCADRDSNPGYWLGRPVSYR